MMWIDAGPFALRLVLGALAAALTWTAAYGLGQTVFGYLRVGHAAPGRGALAAAVGYALLGTIVGALGLFHVLGPLVGVLLVGIALLELYEHRRHARHLAAYARAELHRFAALPLTAKAATAAAALAFAFGAVAAALPAVFWDPIAYHLPIAARALALHTFAFDPGMVQTGFPSLGEAAALPAYAIGASAGAAMATLGAGIALALLCGAWAEHLQHGAGRLATTLVACSALWLWLAPSFYVDVPYAAFAVGALLAAALATEASAGDTSLRYAIVAGTLAGGAAAVKYPGLAVVALAIAAIVLASSTRSWRARVTPALGAAGAALIIAAGWYLRGAMLTGDALYPFLTALGAGPVHDFGARYAQMTARWCGGGTALGDAIALPWRLLTQPRAFCGDPGYALDLAAIFAVAALAVWRRVLFPLVALALLTALWFATAQQWRFLIPAVGLFAVIAAVGATAATGRLRAGAHGLLIALCLIGIGVDVAPDAASDTSNPLGPAYAYIAGAQSGDAYLASRLETYSAARWLRGQAQGARVAALDDVRDYYFGRRVVWLNPFYQNRWRIDWTLPSAVRWRALVASGVAYLVVDENSAFRSRTPTEVDGAALAADVRAGALMPAFVDGAVTVYALQAPSR